MKNNKIKEFYCSNQCRYCGEEECETIFILTNKQKIVMRDCDPSHESIEDKLNRINNKNKK